jgi:hypothetical protein
MFHCLANLEKPYAVLSVGKWCGSGGEILTNPESYGVTVDECSELCQKHEDCEYFMYNKINGMCYWTESRDYNCYSDTRNQIIDFWVFAKNVGNIRTEK